VGLLGLTYKPGTSTIRRSSAIEMLVSLTDAGATMRAYDPMADAGELAPYAARFQRCDSAYDVAAGADALVVATPWPEVLELDWRRIQGVMKTPLLIDAGNYLEAEEMERAGFIYQGVGRGKRA
jgi:UDPglucose 6-dehydrogenase